MERTSSRRPEELIVSGFQRTASQASPHHHGNAPLSSTSISVEGHLTNSFDIWCENWLKHN